MSEPFFDFVFDLLDEGEFLLLEVALPFTSREEVQLTRSGDEILLQVGGWRRSIVLPRALVDAPTTGAKMEDGILKIQFGSRQRATTGGKPR